MPAKLPPDVRKTRRQAQQHTNYLRRKGRVLGERPCARAACGVTFPVTGTNGTNAFCSQRCANLTTVSRLSRESFQRAGRTGGRAAGAKKRREAAARIRQRFARLIGRLCEELRLERTTETLRTLTSALVDVHRDGHQIGYDRGYHFGRKCRSTAA